MSNDLDLRFRDRMHLVLHNIVSRTGVGGLKPVAVKRIGTQFELTIQEHRLLVPSALLWRSYRRGWTARMQRLAAEFGLDGTFKLAPGDTVIDIGANVGDFALLAAGQGAKVLCLDGDPVVVECLSANTAAIPDISTDCAILWKEACELTFYSAPGKADSSIFLPPGESVAAFTAQSQTLDSVVARHGLGDIALLKMDAEGAEPEVLEGATEVLRRTRHVAIDTGPERNGAETGEACADILRAAGFSLLPSPATKRRMTFASRIA